MFIRAQACRYEAATTGFSEEGLRVFPVYDPVMARASIARDQHLSGTGVGCNVPHPAANTCQLPRACDHTFGVGCSFSKIIRPSYSLAQLDTHASSHRYSRTTVIFLGVVVSAPLSGLQRLLILHQCARRTPLSESPSTAHRSRGNKPTINR